jgi:hypothetical protein
MPVTKPFQDKICRSLASNKHTSSSTLWRKQLIQPSSTPQPLSQHNPTNTKKFSITAFAFEFEQMISYKRVD